MLNIFKSLQFSILIICLISVDHCKQDSNNAFVIEYFLYRAPSTVVGFTCNKYESDVQLIKQFSNVKLQSAVWKLENKIELPLVAKTIYRKLGIFIDLRCQFSENVRLAFTEATNHKMFDELYYWLILGSDLNESLSLINDNSFGLSTDFVVAIFEENQCILYDIYNPCKIRGGTLKTTQLGIWNESSGLNILLKINKVQRWNLEGMKLKITGLVKNRPPNISVIEYLQDYNYKQFDRMTRLGYAMWMHLAEMFNFTLDFYENTTWNDEDAISSVMNALTKGDIDVSGTVDKMTNERINLVKAVYPALPFRTCFIFRSTSSDRLSVRDIFLPLSSKVWYLTIGLSVLSINALAFISVFTKQNFYENYLRSILIHIGAFCQQGTEFSSSSLSGRIAILHILLFNLLVYNYYLASAVSNRLSEPITFINDSLNELRKKDFQYASEPILDFDHYIKSNDWETRSFYVNTWLKIPESQKFMPLEKGMSLVLKGGFAYHTNPESSYAYVEQYFDDRKICELQEVHLIKPLQLSIFIHINSSFTEMFKAGFTKLSEVGIRYRQIQQWSARKPICRTDVLTADSITIKEIAPIIIFLLFSMLISGTILTAEFFYWAYYNRNMGFGLKKSNAIGLPEKSNAAEEKLYKLNTTE